MLLRLAEIFGHRTPEIPKALISACRTKQNAEHGRPVPKALIHTVLTAPTLLILPAPTKWFPCWAQAVISCITILPIPLFIATAK